MASECPDNCCKGWQVPIDEKTYDRYRSLEGIFGRHVRSFVKKKSDPKVFRRCLGVCPFFTSDRLCLFQCTGREELMPLVCREFPKQVVTMGDRCEVSLLFSCPAVTRMFLDHLGPGTYVESNREYDPYYSIGNEDEAFLAFLLGEREKIVSYIWEEPRRPLGQVWQSLYAYVRTQHQYLMRNSVRDKVKDVILTDDKEKQGEYALVTDPGVCFFKITTLDRMILNHIDYGWLQIRDPKLYRLIRIYTRKISQLPLDRAELWFHEQVTKLMEEAPEYEEKYRSYFSYLIQQLYPMAYENYFMLRQLLFAILYVQLLMMFDLMDHLATGRVADKDRQAEILLMTEKALRHNQSLTDNLLTVIRQEFL
ncbi:MAG: flagellin lysine-N-methylase [Lachnospiraceae bacterium]|nr:flagellin lysine-N-methylase [Lachnospiraceae bacterium]